MCDLFNLTPKEYEKFLIKFAENVKEADYFKSTDIFKTYLVIQNKKLLFEIVKELYRIKSKECEDENNV